ncbi:hypothetical protein QP175_15630 [Sphingomonas aerolata]
MSGRSKRALVALMLLSAPATAQTSQDRARAIAGSPPRRRSNSG